MPIICLTEVGTLCRCSIIPNRHPDIPTSRHPGIPTAAEPPQGTCQEQLKATTKVNLQRTTDFAGVSADVQKSLT